MKANPSKQNKSEPNKPNNKSHLPSSEESLDQVAEELSRLAHKRLPDRVLGGILTGQEDDIRQEAILLALTWYLRGDSTDPDLPVKAWLAPRAIAGALRIVKRDKLKLLLGEAEHQLEVPAPATLLTHPAMIPACDWPTDVMRSLCERALRIALHDGTISPLNAAVATAVYVDGIHVADLADRRGVHRSNIYQHLTRSRPHVQEVIKRLEVSLVEISSTSSLKKQHA